MIAYAVCMREIETVPLRVSMYSVSNKPDLTSSDTRLLLRSSYRKSGNKSFVFKLMIYDLYS
jgi:hypothetical protein